MGIVEMWRVWTVRKSSGAGQRPRLASLSKTQDQLQAGQILLRDRPSQSSVPSLKKNVPGSYCFPPWEASFGTDMTWTALDLLEWHLGDLSVQEKKNGWVPFLSRWRQRRNPKGSPRTGTFPLTVARIQRAASLMAQNLTEKISFHFQ